MKNEKELIKSVYKLVDFNITEPNNLAIELLSQKLEEQELITFTLEYRENQSDSWLQAEFLSHRINKTIIIDYSFPDNFETIDQFIKVIIQTQNDIDKIENIKEIIKNQNEPTPIEEELRIVEDALDNYEETLRDLVETLEKYKEQGKVNFAGDLIPYEVVRIDQTMNAKIENAKELLK